MKNHFAGEPLSPRIFTLSIFLIAGGIGFPVAAADTPPADVRAVGESPAGIPASAADVESFLTDTVARYRIPGLSVAIVDRNGVAYSAGFGTMRDGTPVTEKTPFLLGSTTKTFTALAVLSLACDGKIGLDDPVTAYLPEFEVAVPGAANKITVRHLLNHTSGLSDKGLPCVATGTDSLAAEIALMKKCVPEREPGAAYRYFNGNYRILGAVMERVSGMPYGECLRSALFAPLSMGPSTGTPETVEGIAEGHGSLFGFPIRRKQVYRPGALPSGYLASSASDVSRFLIDELRAGSSDGVPVTGASILSPDLVRSSWSSPSNIPDGYAMGWLPVRLASGKRILCHGGSLENYQSFFYLDPEAGNGFVFMMNQGGLIPMTGAFNTVRNGLVNILSGEKPAPGPGLLPAGLAAIAVFAILALEISLTVRLPKWKAKAEGRGARRIVTGILGGVAVSSIPVYLVPLMNNLTGDRADWPTIWGLLPEFCMAIFLISSFSFVRVVYKSAVCASKRKKN